MGHESEALLFARLRVIKQRQLGMLHEAVHTSKNSSLVIDSALDES
jgi:hypothetical protein